MAWTALTYSFGSLLTSTKMTQLYDDITAAFNKDASAPVLANDYVVTDMVTDLNITEAKVAALAISEGKLAALAVTQGKLKTSITSEVSTSDTSGVNLTLPGGSYGFYPQTRGDGSSGVIAQIVNYNSPSGSYVTYIFLQKYDATGSVVYAQQRYIQASPPYKIGGEDWGHFLFLLRRVSDGVVVASYQAEDPPWAYNGLVHLPKDDLAKITEVPHPFADYFLKDPAVDGLEIVLVNLNAVNTKKWVDDNRKIGKGLLEDIPAVLTGKGKPKKWTDYTVPTIGGFTDKVKVIEP